MAILTVTVVGLVVIVTLMKVGLGGQAGGAGAGGVSVSAEPMPHLTFTMAQGSGSRFDPSFKPEQEIKSEGHVDFWFANDKDAPVDVYVMHLSCNRCLSVTIGLAPEGARPAQLPGADVAWQKMDTEEMHHNAKAFTVPPKRGGWVRMNWKDEEPGERRLSVDVRTTSPVGPAPPARLEYTAAFIDPVRALPEDKELSVETLSSGDERPHTAQFTVYSSTREHFTLEPQSEGQQKERHPFVTCGRPVPLTEEECRGLEKEHKRAFLCGYKVPVTVAERLKDGREHDLGPFRTGVRLKTDVSDDDMVLYVHGTVRGGGVRVVGDESLADRIALGTFRRDGGAEKTVRVETRPGTKLTVEKKPEFLETELKDESAGAGKTWGLKVTVRAGSVNGHFPQADDPALSDTSVYLKADGRLLRIPVSGTASQH